MKSTPWIIIGICLVLSACQMGGEGTQHKEAEKGRTEAETKEAFPTETAPALPYLTHFNTQTEKFEIDSNPDFQGEADTAVLIRSLKQRYPQISLVIDHISEDTLYLQIPDALYLTQSMGSAGATTFLIESTFGFTTVPSIKVVNFEFEEGDHAVPGPYTRTSFEEFLK